MYLNLLAIPSIYISLRENAYVRENIMHTVSKHWLVIWKSYVSKFLK